MRSCGKLRDCFIWDVVNLMKCSAIARRLLNCNMTKHILLPGNNARETNSTVHRSEFQGGACWPFSNRSVEAQLPVSNF